MDKLKSMRICNKKKRRNRFIYTLFLTVYGTTVMIISMIIVGYCEDINEDRLKFIHNWDSDPLNEFSFNSTCSGEWEPLLRYQYPAFPQLGTIQGCFCPNSGFKKYDCSRQDIGNGCLKVAATSETNLTLWGNQNTSEKFQICFKRLKSHSFIDISSKLNINNGTCQSGYIKCLTLGGDQQFYCVETGQQCPITAIKISQYEQLDGFESIKIDSFNYLLYSRIQQQTPIVDIKLSEAGICQPNGNMQIDYQVRKSDYPLVKKKKIVNCTLDNRYIPLDYKINEQFLFDLNNLSQIVKNLPQFSPQYYNSQINYQGMYRGQIKWNQKCFQTAKEMAENQKKIKQIQTNQENLSLLSILYFTIMVLTLIQCEIYRCLKRLIFILCKQFIRQAFLMRTLMKFIVQIPQGAFIMKSYLDGKEQIEFLQKQIDQHCPMEEQTIQNFQYIIDTIHDNIISRDKTIVYFFGIASIIDILFLIYYVANNCKQQKKLPPQNQLFDQQNANSLNLQEFQMEYPIYELESVKGNGIEEKKFFYNLETPKMNIHPQFPEIPPFK